MRLSVGERLEGAGPPSQPGGYLVTALVRETPWYALYAGKKVFYNFDFSAKRVREADPREWLDVLVRTLRYPVLDDRRYVEDRRALARSEARGVLGSRRGQLWPEPVDLLEVPNTRDPFGFSWQGEDGREPVVVFAHPRGPFLNDWLQQVLPLGTVLTVLAELLDFVGQVHDDGLVLLTLGPSLLLVDAGDRVHYLGGDAALPRTSPLLQAATAGERWRRLYPADRFEPGFAAPECFDAERRPDGRADLYSWGCLVVQLLIGDETLPHAVGAQPWATFAVADFARVEAVLAQLPAGAVRAWADELRVPADALAPGWPGNVAALLRRVLSPDPGDRPATVAELRAWCVALPPPAVAGLVALQVDPGMATLLVDAGTLRSDAGLVVCRAGPDAPLDPSQGTAVYEGPLRPVVHDATVPLTLQVLHYTAFVKSVGPAGDLYSAGVSAPLWTPRPDTLRAWVEEQLAASAGRAPEEGAPVPARVAMALSVLPFDDVAAALLLSTQPRVRSAVLWRLEHALDDPTRLPRLEPWLWHLARDRAAPLRQRALQNLWRSSADTSDDRLLKLLDALDAPGLDAPFPYVPFLRGLGLDEERIRQTLGLLEARRPTPCVLCGLFIPAAERTQHLRDLHGYLSYEGDVYPTTLVLDRLWERVFSRQDRSAHDQLVRLYLSDLPALDESARLDRYVGDLEKYLAGLLAPAAPSQETLPVALPLAAYLAYLTFLREGPLFPRVVPLLLGTASPRLQELGREAVLTWVAATVGREVNALAAALERACPNLVAEQLLLCERLPLHGFDAATAAACAARLRDEQVVACPACGARVRQRDRETHLRRAHGVYEFRGERSSLPGLRRRLLAAVCTAPPDPHAWHTLEVLLREASPFDVERHLLAGLSRHLRRLPQRGPALHALADTVVAVGRGVALLPALAGPARSPARALLGQRLALEIAARLKGPPAEVTLAAVKPLLAERRLPRKARASAALALWRGVGPDRLAALKVLRAYVANTGKLRAIERLRQLEPRFGPSPLLEEVVRSLDDQVRMTCPRCPTQLRKKDMVRHLWERHGLVLDGQRVREPWRVLEDWAAEYGLEKDPDLLKRGMALALQVDPAGGLLRFYRLCCRAGSGDAEMLAALQAQARAGQAGLCPHCFEMIPVALPEPEAVLTLTRDRLEGAGYRLELSTRGLVPKLTVETPTEYLHRGREPGRLLTRRGGTSLLFAALAGTIFALLEFLADAAYPTGLVAVLAVGLALILAAAVYLVWPEPPPSRDRLLTAAWEELVPDLLNQPLAAGAFDFVQGLARLSIARHFRPPRTALDTLRRTVQRAAWNSPRAATGLAALDALAVQHQRDGASVAAGLARAGFDGRLPLAYLAALLPLLGREPSSRGQRARLQLLIAREAFLADMTINDWLLLGRVDAGLKAALNLDNRWGWLQRYVLWADRNRRHWEAVGLALDVFEAAEPSQGTQLLEATPDLLLHLPRSRVVVGTRGVWFDGVCVGVYQPGMAVIGRKSAGPGYEVLVGDLRIPCDSDPAPNLDELQRWLAYYFLDFLPTVPGASRPGNESEQALWRANQVACPNCRRAVVPCRGEVGVGVRGG